MGRYSPKQDLTPFQGKEITIETRRHLHVDVDGDVLTRTPARIHVLPKALRIFTPV